MALSELDERVAADASLAPAALDPRAINPVALVDARSLSGALDGAEAGGLTLRASVITSPPPAGCWIASPAGQALLDPPLTPERTVAVAEAIDRLDPLWDHIERVLGQPLEFDGTTPVPPDGAVAVRIDWTGEAQGTALFVALATVPPGPPPAPSSDAHLPLRLTCDGPRLGVEEAATMATGDLLILPPGGWRADASTPGRADRAGVFEPMTGEWRDGGGARMDEDDQGGQAARDFAVATRLQLPTLSVTVGELEALRPGATLPLGPVTAGLEVTVGVAGRTVAVGELIRLGDQFAVLITGGATALAPPAEED